MTIKTLLGMASGNRSKVNSGSGGNWTFGWSPSQALALSTNAKPNNLKRGANRSDRAVGMYGVLATRSINGR